MDLQSLETKDHTVLFKSQVETFLRVPIVKRFDELFENQGMSILVRSNKHETDVGCAEMAVGAISKFQ
jgi:hypothetical protein